VYHLLWGYLKAEVFKHRLKIIEGLKEALRQEISAIPLDIYAGESDGKLRERLHNLCVIYVRSSSM